MSNTEFKAGDKVKCIDDAYVKDYFTVGEIYIITRVYYPDHLSFSHTGVAMWHSDRFELIEKENTVNKPKQFNPQPGDKIICNNGEEFICCTREFLSSKKLTGGWHYKFYSYRDNPSNEYFGIDWTGWDSGGKASEDEGFNIREVIPKKQEQSVPEETEVKPELTYTTEDIRKAFIEDMEWSEAAYDMIMKSLEKVTSKDYKEYLRLKGIYEPEHE